MIIPRQLLAWRKKYISERAYMVLISMLIGIVSGLAAVILKQAVHFIHHFLTSEAYADNLVQLAYPVIGILVTVALSKLLYQSEPGHSISDILYSIFRKSSFIPRSKMYSKMVTSAVTVGFGGSVGLESPIVMTGSAIGSNIARWLDLNYSKRTLMIGCGTAGVISAIFNAPITGLIFALEVILADVTISKFIPLLIASVSATLVSILLLGDDVLFSFRIVDAFRAADLPFYIGLGIICGFTSLYFTQMQVRVEGWFGGLKHPYTRALTGGLILSFLIFLCPPVYGEGYPMIMAMLTGKEVELIERSVFYHELISNGWIFFGYLVVLILVKAVATAITIGSGGSGGTFAPSLFLGGVTGFAFSRLVNLSGVAAISESNFTLVGMCGVICGIQYAPLTAIFLIAEITGGYTLFVPLMLVSAIAFSTVSYYEPYSAYVRELMNRGDYLRGDEDRKVLSSLNINNLIERDIKTIHHDAFLEDLVKLISVSRRNLFPVVNKEQELMGIITLDNVREIMFDPERQRTVKVTRLMEPSPSVIEYGESMETVMNEFESSGAWNLPVVKDGKYEGMVSKSRIFMLYRKQLIKQSRDDI